MWGTLVLVVSRAGEPLRGTPWALLAGLLPFRPLLEGTPSGDENGKRRKKAARFVRERSKSDSEDMSE